MVQLPPAQSVSQTAPLSQLTLQWPPTQVVWQWAPDRQNIVTFPLMKLPLHVPDAQSQELVLDEAAQAGSPEGGNVVCAPPPSTPPPPSAPAGAGPTVQS